ncbi:MAG: HAMP domain-containing histidine kinase [Cyclobacteriaceae bacterium]|nr:HAMP domain-containing histidine kinase [Cyclobacteriaceae bacterium]
MSNFEDDKRLHEILEMIGRVAALDFSKMLPTSEKNDMIDAISLGLNMLSEELNSNVVEKSKLDKVNQKLEKFAYTTAHDLKTPLNSINGLVDLLELTLKPQNGTDVHEILTRMKKTTGQMKDLVHGILDFSKTDVASIVKEVIDLHVLCKEIVDSDRIGERSTVKFSERLPVVMFSKLGLEQVIRNLLNNAVKYMNKEQGEITFHVKEEDTYFQIGIADNGPGIAPEYQESIFEMFNRIDIESNADSQGIGLATVKNILDAFGERVWVESVPGEGATFWFTLKKEKKES